MRIYNMQGFVTPVCQENRYIISAPMKMKAIRPSRDVSEKDQGIKAGK